MKMLDLDVTMELSTNNGDSSMATANEKETKWCTNFNGAVQMLFLKIEIILFGIVFVNTINNEFGTQFENQNCSIDCKLAHGLDTFCFNAIGIEIPENVFDNENFYNNGYNCQSPYPKTITSFISQVVIILNKMNDVTTKITDLKGILDICLHQNNNNNEIIFGMFDRF